jgi:predicted DNA-binding mobile mystery protein A
MTMAQLGRRLGVSAPAIAALEGSEARGAISLARLSNAAEAMGCDLVVTFVPRVPLTEMVRQQAMRKARQDQDRLLHTMRLEGQEAGVGSPEAIDRSAARWMEGRPARLWD